ncbi:hypothetical protein ACPEIF_00795 [Streptomyces sp. NPDC012600]|uniref:hypothetical protein n=1 Tax=Streptomyces TaxID=1883 RepID=UPI0036B0A822
MACGTDSFLGGAVPRLQEQAFGGPAGHWSPDKRFTFGGYARTPPELDTFATDCREAGPC